VHRNLCTDGKRNEADNFRRDLAGSDLQEEDEAAKIELGYSTTDDINRA
jgi:hypothetical protein